MNKNLLSQNILNASASANVVLTAKTSFFGKFSASPLHNRVVSIAVLLFLSIQTSFAQVEVNRTKSYQGDLNANVQEKVDNVALSKNLLLLHTAMKELSALKDASAFEKIANASLIDFKRLCPNYPQDHFSKMNSEELLPWVEKYPSQAKALKEILEYVNSELKK